MIPRVQSFRIVSRTIPPSFQWMFFSSERSGQHLKARNCTLVALEMCSVLVVHLYLPRLTHITNYLMSHIKSGRRITYTISLLNSLLQSSPTLRLTYIIYVCKSHIQLRDHVCIFILKSYPSVTSPCYSVILRNPHSSTSHDTSDDANPLRHLPILAKLNGFHNAWESGTSITSPKSRRKHDMFEPVPAVQAWLV
jgi:hypothetical protein